MPALTLHKCPKVYVLETHRSRTPDSTLRFIDRMKEILGMSSFQESTNLDRIGIPVFTCERLRPDNSRTSHTGKGVSKTQAQVSLLMESIERYSSEFRSEYLERLVQGPYQNLRSKYNVLDPGELILPRFTNFSANKDLYWVWGYDIVNEEDILVPACSVYHPFHIETENLIDTHTNGLASGNTMEEAIFHGLTEIIERDAWSIAKFNHEMDNALVVDDHPGHQFIIDLIEKFEKAEIQVTAKDITSDIGVPVIAAFSEDLVHSNMIPIDGFGAHLDPRVAMARALLEMTTTRALFIQKYGIKGLQETASHYYRESYDADPRFYAHEKKYLGEIKSEYSEDVLQDIQIILKKLRERGLKKVIVVDLTRSDVGIPTVRVIVPGMEVYCFDRKRKGERLYNSQGK